MRMRFHEGGQISSFWKVQNDSFFVLITRNVVHRVKIYALLLQIFLNRCFYTPASFIPEMV